MAAAAMLSLDQSKLRTHIEKLLNNKKLPLIIGDEDEIFALI
jgi:hypothetical protein